MVAAAATTRNGWSQQNRTQLVKRARKVGAVKSFIARKLRWLSHLLRMGAAGNPLVKGSFEVLLPESTKWQDAVRRAETSDAESWNEWVKVVTEKTEWRWKCQNSGSLLADDENSGNEEDIQE